MFKNILLSASLIITPIASTTTFAHDENVATRGECTGFFHGDRYCAYIEDVNSIGNQLAVNVFLDHNNADWWNDYIIDCEEGWVEKVTPPRRRGQSNQANRFDRALFNQVC